MSNQPTRIPDNIKMNEEDRPVTEEGKVIITKEAFLKMITHVLRFAHEDLEESIEVMGVCIGKQEGNTMKVLNAIPITHGNKVEVGFSNEDYAAFAQVDEKYSEKGLYSIGWYHSHPGWGLFFSDTDKKNQLSYQSEQSPYGFGIVFDHTLMGKDGNLGFDVFRLDDISKGSNSDFIRVAHEIEKPESLDYFKWVKKLVEDTQRKDPVLIEELTEKRAGAPGELQQIPTSPEQQSASDDPYPQITPFIDGYKEGSAKISEIFLRDFKNQLGMWTKDLNLGVLSGSKHLKNTLSEMEEGFSFGIDKVQQWFEESLADITNEFQEDVLGYLDKRMESQKALQEESENTADDLSADTEEMISSKMSEIIAQMDAKVKTLSETVQAVKKKEKDTGIIIEESASTVSKLKTELTGLSETLQDNLKEHGDSLEKEFTEQLSTLEQGIDQIDTSYSDIKQASKQLKDIATKFRNL